MKKIFLLLLVVAFAENIKAQSWNLVWSDEFDGPLLNTSNWTYEIGTGNGGWGNNELQYYTNRPENIKIVNGELVITALQESYGGRNYTSARIKTQGKKSFKYGKIEAYMKIPMGQGSWPAFWALGESITSVSWPRCGEIDIMEHKNNETQISGAVHWGNASGQHVQESKTTVFDVSRYHLYTIEWNETQIKWFIDFKPYYTFNIANNINNTEEFHAPFFILFNLAIGGNFPGNPDGTMQFPIQMNIDYVKVYELVTSVNEEESLPTKYELMQNYPNPFNPSTVIRFKVQAPSHVTLKVYDVLGNEVATLVDENKPAGSYKVDFNVETRDQPRQGRGLMGGASLQSGVFFYRLIANGFSETKKMLLIK